MLLLGAFSSNVNAQNRGVNWYDLCKNPIVDIAIAEPCSELTTNGGYTLTSEGERVLACLTGGAAAVLAGQPELLALKNKVGCETHTHSSYSGPSASDNLANNRQSDPIGDLLGNLFN